MRAFSPTIRLHKQLPTFASLMAGMMASSATHFDPIVKPLPRSSYPEKISYGMHDFRRQDERPDANFYAQPRFVHHIDDAAIARLKNYYSTIIKPENSVLDLCSSWTSHLPDDLKAATCLGIGLNEAELLANGHLTGHLVRDLNEQPEVAEVADGSMDVVICNVSIDYLTRPVEVLGEMRRVLKEGGTAHMAFSNRCFPTKVVGKWLNMDDADRRKWVGGYFWADNAGVATQSTRVRAVDSKGTGDWVDVEEVVLNDGGYDDPLYVVRARKSGNTAGGDGEKKSGKLEL